MIVSNDLSRFGEHRFIYRIPEDECGQAPMQLLSYEDAIVSLRHPRMK